MNVSQRERSFWRQLGHAAAVSCDASVTDLFGHAEAAERRRHHLAFVIRRKAQLFGGMVEIPDLVGLSEEQLEGIRKALSARIAFLKLGTVKAHSPSLPAAALRRRGIMLDVGEL